MPENEQMTFSCNDDLTCWLVLTFLEDIGPVTGRRLLSIFHSPRKVFEASFSELKDIEGIKANKGKEDQGVRCLEQGRERDSSGTAVFRQDCHLRQPRIS